MATITKGRCAPAYEPTPEQIAAELELIHQRRLKAFDARWAERDRLAAEREAERKQKRIAKRRAKGNWGFNILNSMLQEKTDSEPLDLPIPEAMNYDNIPHVTICGKVPVGPDGPQEMSADDRRGFAVTEANARLDATARELRWTLVDVDRLDEPEEFDVADDERLPSAPEVPQFNSPTVWAQTARDVKSYRSKRR